MAAAAPSLTDIPLPGSSPPAGKQATGSLTDIPLPGAAPPAAAAAPKPSGRQAPVLPIPTPENTGVTPLPPNAPLSGPLTGPPSGTLAGPQGAPQVAPRQPVAAPGGESFADLQRQLADLNAQGDRAGGASPALQRRMDAVAAKMAAARSAETAPLSMKWEGTARQTYTQPSFEVPITQPVTTAKGLQDTVGELSLDIAPSPDAGTKLPPRGRPVAYKADPAEAVLRQADRDVDTLPGWAHQKGYRPAETGPVARLKQQQAQATVGLGKVLPGIQGEWQAEDKQLAQRIASLEQYARGKGDLFSGGMSPTEQRQFQTQQQQLKQDLARHDARGKQIAGYTQRIQQVWKAGQTTPIHGGDRYPEETAFHRPGTGEVLLGNTGEFLDNLLGPLGASRKGVEQRLINNMMLTGELPPPPPIPVTNPNQRQGYIRQWGQVRDWAQRRAIAEKPGAYDAFAVKNLQNEWAQFTPWQRKAADTAEQQVKAYAKARIDSGRGAGYVADASIFALSSMTGGLLGHGAAALTERLAEPSLARMATGGAARYLLERAPALAQAMAHGAGFMGTQRLLTGAAQGERPLPLVLGTGKAALEGAAFGGITGGVSLPVGEILHGAPLHPLLKRAIQTGAGVGGASVASGGLEAGKALATGKGARGAARAGAAGLASGAEMGAFFEALHALQGPHEPPPAAGQPARPGMPPAAPESRTPPRTPEELGNWAAYRGRSKGWTDAQAEAVGRVVTRIAAMKDPENRVGLWQSLSPAVQRLLGSLGSLHEEPEGAAASPVTPPAHPPATATIGNEPRITNADGVSLSLRHMTPDAIEGVAADAERRGDLHTAAVARGWLSLHEAHTLHQKPEIPGEQYSAYINDKSKPGNKPIAVSNHFKRVAKNIEADNPDLAQKLKEGADAAERDHQRQFHKAHVETADNPTPTLQGHPLASAWDRMSPEERASLPAGTQRDLAVQSVSNSLQVQDPSHPGVHRMSEVPGHPKNQGDLEQIAAKLFQQAQETMAARHPAPEIAPPVEPPAAAPPEAVQPTEAPAAPAAPPVVESPVETAPAAPEAAPKPVVTEFGRHWGGELKKAEPEAAAKKPDHERTKAEFVKTEGWGSGEDLHLGHPQGLPERGQPGIGVEEVPGSSLGTRAIVLRGEDGRLESSMEIWPLQNEINKEPLVKVLSVYTEPGLQGKGRAKSLYQELTRLGYRTQPLENRQFSYEGAAIYHAWAVRQALERGETVPPEVLADYPKLQSQMAKPAAEPVGKLGHETKFRAGEQIVSGRWAVVDAGQLSTSHTDQLTPNAAYPAELQPRDRTRRASLDQVAHLETRLDPEDMAENRLAQHGAPIVGPDGVVESGNARTIALRRAYGAGSEVGARYAAWLEENAARFGLKPADVAGHRHPVLVRVRATVMSPKERIAFTRAANERETAAMGAAEAAKGDAGILTPSLMATFAPGADGSLNAASNRGFVNDFIAALPVAEHGEMRQADGSLSQSGLKRIENAVFAAAYGEEGAGALARLSEATDEPTKNITGALRKTAGFIADLRDRIRAGTVHPGLNLAPDLMAAVDKLAVLRDQNMTVPDYLAQQQMFDRELSPMQEQVLAGLHEFRRSGKKVAALLTAYTDRAQQAGDPSSGVLFSGIAIPTKEEVWTAALSRVREMGADEPRLFEAGEPGKTEGSAPTAGPAGRTEPEKTTEPVPGGKPTSEGGAGEQPASRRRARPAKQPGAAAGGRTTGSAAGGRPGAGDQEAAAGAKGTAKTHGVIEGEVVAPETKAAKPLWEMSPDDLDAAYEQVKRDDRRMHVDLFGLQGAAEYRALQARANSSHATGPQIDEAAAQIERMEALLTPAERQRLNSAVDPEEIREYQRALGQLDASSAAELGESLKYALTQVGQETDPTRMTGREQVAYAMLREGMRLAVEHGLDTTEVTKQAVKGAAERHRDPEDAGFMLRRFAKEFSPQTPESPAAKKAAAALPPKGFRSGQIGLLRSNKPPAAKPPGFENPAYEQWREQNTAPTPPAEQEKWYVRLGHQMTRRTEHLPTDAYHAPLDDRLKRLQSLPQLARQKATTLIAEPVKDLSPEERSLFTSWLLHANWTENATKGIPNPPEIEAQGHEGLVAEGTSLLDRIAASPKVQEAVVTWRKNLDGASTAYAKSKTDIGQAAPGFTREDWYHQEFLAPAMETARLAAEGAKAAGGRRQVKAVLHPDFTLRREGGVNYHADPVQAHFNAMADMIAATERNKIVALLQKPEHEGGYNAMPVFKAKQALGKDKEARQWFNDLEGRGGAVIVREIPESVGQMAVAGMLPDEAGGKWQHVIDAIAQNHALNTSGAVVYDAQGRAPFEIDPSLTTDLRDYARRIREFYEVPVGGGKAESARFPTGYQAYRFVDGNTLYKAHSLPERLAQELIDGVVAELQVKRSDLRDILAVGRSPDALLLRDSVARTIGDLQPDRPDLLQQLFRKTVRGSKMFGIMNPEHTMPLIKEHLVGSMFQIAQANPKIFGSMPQAIADVWNARSGAFGRKKAQLPSESYQKFLFQGAGRDFQTTIGNVGTDEGLNYLAKLAADTRSQPEKFWDGAKRLVVAGKVPVGRLDEVFRHSIFLHTLADIEKNGGPTNYLSARPDLADAIGAINGPDALAYYLSDQLMGAYGDMPQMLRQVSNVIPSAYTGFLFGKAKSQTGIMANNLWRYPKIQRAIAARMGWQERSTGRLALEGGTRFILPFALLSGALAANNLLRFRKQEDEMKPQGLHLDLGRFPDGRMIVLDRVGSLPGLVNLTGLDDAWGLTRQIANGHLTPKDVARQIGMSGRSELAAMVGQAKVPVEIATGHRLATGGRILDMYQYLADSVHVGELWRQVQIQRGQAVPAAPGGERALATLAGGRLTDPAEEAFRQAVFHAKDWINQQRQIPQEVKADSAWTPLSAAIYGYGRSLQQRDYASAEKYVVAIAKARIPAVLAMKGAKPEKLYNAPLQKALERMEPLYGIPAAQLPRYLKSLAPTERVQLRSAYIYYARFAAPGVAFPRTADLGAFIAALREPVQNAIKSQLPISDWARSHPWALSQMKGQIAGNKKAAQAWKTGGALVGAK